MKEVIDEFAIVDEDEVLEESETNQKSRQNTSKGEDLESSDSSVIPEKRGGRRTKSKPRKMSPLPTAMKASPSKDSKTTNPEAKTKTNLQSTTIDDSEIAEDVDQIVAF